jgi:hypothetical protein
MNASFNVTDGISLQNHTQTTGDLEGGNSGVFIGASEKMSNYLLFHLDFFEVQIASKLEALEAARTDNLKANLSEQIVEPESLSFNTTIRLTITAPNQL